MDQILDVLNTINLLKKEENVYEEDMIDIVNYLSNGVANILQALSTMINGRQPSLNLDQERASALPLEYDTDLENFWTNPSKLIHKFDKFAV